MTLQEFLSETQAEVRAQMSDGSPFAELVFAEVVMQHLADVGMTFDKIASDHSGVDRLDLFRHLQAPLDGRHVGGFLVDDAEAVVGQVAPPVDAGQARRRHVDLDQRGIFGRLRVNRRQTDDQGKEENQRTQHGNPA